MSALEELDVSDMSALEERDVSDMSALEELDVSDMSGSVRGPGLVSMSPDLLIIRKLEYRNKVRVAK